jgi:hypothetical protein
MNRIHQINAIAQGIMAGYYGSRQSCGTEYQKWTHAVLQADQIYKGDLIIDTEELSDEGKAYVQKHIINAL